MQIQKDLSVVKVLTPEQEQNMNGFMREATDFTRITDLFRFCLVSASSQPNVVLRTTEAKRLKGLFSARLCLFVGFDWLFSLVWFVRCVLPMSFFVMHEIRYLFALLETLLFVLSKLQTKTGAPLFLRKLIG